MAETGRQTINDTDVLECDADPSQAGQGLSAPVGSVAILNSTTDTIKYGYFQKVGAGDNDWAPMNPGRKSGTVALNQWAGTPKKHQVTFNIPFQSTNYVVHITGSSDVRLWTYEFVTVNGFTINANANAPLTGNVSWTAQLVEETS